ncbi:MAG: DoxX family protein [Herpetosiphonaceae bacterium]|nr:DoxX family protein [Herpetosiphonaceae bacterium]
MARVYSELDRRFAAYQSLVTLLLRLAVGLTFFFSGYGKVAGGVAGTSKFFGSLGIPFPALMGPFISYLELIGGAAIIIGLLTRVFALLLMGDMAVAILVALLPKALKAASMAAGWATFRTEVLLFMGCAALLVAGAGVLSADAALRNPRGRQVVEERPITP